MPIRKLFIAVLLILPLFRLQAQIGTKPLTPTSDTVIAAWNYGGNALNTLKNLSFQNKIPFGVVIEGEALCTHQVNGKPGSTIAELLSSVEADVPGYTGHVENGVLVIRPKLLTRSTFNMLDVKLLRFGSATPNSLQSLSITLWMFLRAALVPGQGSAFSGGVQRDAELVPAFELMDVTTEEVLDYLATQQTGGFWFVSGVPENWILNPSTIPFKVFSYSGDTGLAKLITCS